MYAIAILDRDSRVLHVARDRFGEKPLFYAAADGRFAYASDAGVVAALPWIDADPDPLSLRRYLALHYVPGNATIYRGVSRVLPGERLEIALDAPRPKHTRYYVPALPATRTVADDALAAIIERAVVSRLVADVPVGVFLSGGLDSSIVATIAAKHKPGVLTFSIAFGSAEHDESAHARELASTIGSSHHHFVFDETRFASLLPAVAAALDEPLGDQATLPLYWLAREARRHATVVLSGEGADEVFAGYDYYRAFAAGAGMFGGLRHAMRRSPGRDTGSSIIDRLRAETPSGFPLLTDSATRARLVPVDDRSSDTWERDVLAWLSASHDPLQRASAADVATWLPDDLLAKLDRMTMASSLEGRAPYVAPEVVEAGLALPGSQRMRGSDGKIALRRVAARWLPERIRGRRKQGFVLPMRAWLAEWFDAHGGAQAYFVERPVPHVDAAEMARIACEDVAAGVLRERLLFASIMLVEWHAAQKGRVAAMRARHTCALAESAAAI
jgi:asparagine synthase (glutamine-hydrolysing)